MQERIVWFRELILPASVYSQNGIMHLCPRESSLLLLIMTRIFLVDDEPDIANSLRLGLERKGFQVDVFTDPTEALAKYKAHSYDLLLIDIRMPKLNGFELVREIRKIDVDSEVWFLTAFEVYYEEFKKMFPDLGVKSFIRKPVSVNELTNRIGQRVSIAEEKGR
jgi:DNA-binding response OmpR family regulator